MNALSPAREIFLGRTAHQQLVFADVRIEEPTATTVTFVDHTVGPRPVEIGISFTVLRDVPSAHGRPLREIDDRWWEQSGQVSPEDRVLIGKVSPEVRVIEHAWATEHLNLTNAACMHMTEEILTPSPEAFAEYCADQRAKSPWRGYSDSELLQHWKIDRVVCPETGYRWGHAWLARTPDPTIVSALRDALDRLPAVAP